MILWILVDEKDEIAIEERKEIGGDEKNVIRSTMCIYLLSILAFIL